MLSLGFKYVTLLGDLRILIVFFLALSLILYKNKYLGILKWYVFLFVFTMAIIGMAKFYYYSCIGNRGFIFINPSGHMGLAIIAYSPIYLIQKNISNLYINLLSTFIMVLILFLIGFSRYILHYHTINEIILGAMIGALVSLKVISSEIDIQPNFWFNKNVMLFLLCLAFITYFWVDFSSERLVQYVARKSDIIFQCF